jgi:hypothetical protein
MRIRRRRGKPGSTPESRRRQKRRLPELDRRIEDEVEQGKSRRWQKRRLPELDRRIEDEVEQGKSSKGEECGGEEESESSGGHHSESDRKR